MAGNPVVADNVETFPPRVRMMEPRRIRCAFRAGESTFYPYIDEVIRIRARLTITALPSDKTTA